MLSAIVVAAGNSNRFSRNGKKNRKLSKVFVRLGGKPVIYYSLAALNKHPLIGEIIVVTNPLSLDAAYSVVKRYKINKVSKLVLGGKERKDSVLSGLKSLDPRSKYVLIHDGARPFINKDIISSVIREGMFYKAAVVAVPVKPTIKRAGRGMWVKETIKRDELWEIQTPQVFVKDLIISAYKKFGGSKVTDDSMLVEKSGKKVKLVRGAYSNIKITTPEDIFVAEAVLKGLKAR